MRAGSSTPIAWLIALLAGACAGATRAPQPDACAAQICTGDDGGCDMVVLDDVWIWNGHACVQAYDSGCSAVGPDCDSLYPSQADCQAAWSRCIE